MLVLSSRSVSSPIPSASFIMLRLLTLHWFYFDQIKFGNDCHLLSLDNLGAVFVKLTAWELVSVVLARCALL